MRSVLADKGIVLSAATFTFHRMTRRPGRIGRLIMGEVHLRAHPFRVGVIHGYELLLPGVNTSPGVTGSESIITMACGHG